MKNEQWNQLLGAYDSQSKLLFGVLGFVLGFGAPMGSLLFHSFAAESLFSISWILGELKSQSFFYFYMGIATPIAFALFGYIVGSLVDRIQYQARHLKRLNTILARESKTDDITGLYNHRHILEEVNREIARASRYQKPLSGIMIDIDSFKAVNDNHGHLIGDDVIRFISKVLHKNVRKIDIVGRYGGDEFFVVLPECTGAGVKTVAERIQFYLKNNPYRCRNIKINITISMGLCSFDELAKVSSAEFVERADKALLKAKMLGKNQFVGLLDE